MSEYTLPALPSKPPTITPATEKKSQLIKSVLPSSTTKPVVKGRGPQKPISVFLAPKKKECNKETLAARKGALLLRIREKSTIQPLPEIDNGPWERAEWVVSSLFMYPHLSCPPPTAPLHLSFWGDFELTVGYYLTIRGKQKLRYR